LPADESLTEAEVPTAEATDLADVEVEE
jgi:hypothetical protein